MTSPACSGREGGGGGEEERSLVGTDGHPLIGSLRAARHNAHTARKVDNKEDRAEVTLGILIKMPPNLLLDLSPITLGRIKMFNLLDPQPRCGCPGWGMMMYFNCWPETKRR